MLLNRNEPESEDGQYTGQWLLEHEPFTSWLSQDIRYLWCEGMRKSKLRSNAGDESSCALHNMLINVFIAGAGKSTLV